MTLTGTDTLANYEAALRSVTYENTSEDPSGLTRTVSFVVNDGDDDSNALTRDINVTPVNDSPIFTTTDLSPTFIENLGAVSVFSGSSANLIESADLVETLIVTVNFIADGSHEKLIIDGEQIDLVHLNNVTTGANSFDVAVSVTGSTATVTITKVGGYSPASAEALVDGFQYNNTSEDPQGTIRLVTLISIQDDGDTLNGGSDTASIGLASIVTMQAVNDAAVLDLNGSDGGGVDFSASFAEADPPVNVTDTDATITDLDHTTYQQLAINISGFVDGSFEEITVAGYQFQYGTAETQVLVVGSTSFNVNFDGSTGFMITRDGGGDMPESDLQQLIRGVAYQHTGSGVTSGNRIFGFVPQDADGLDGATAISTIAVASVNDPPVVTGIEGTNLAYLENDAATQITNSISVSDLDDTNIESAVVQITGNYSIGEDVLAFVDLGPITGSWNAALGTLTLTGSDSLANYETALRTITYQNTSDDPSGLTRTVSFTVNDGDIDSNTQTRNIDVTPVNDAPVESSIEGTDLAFSENDAPTTITSAITITDVDDTNLESATIQITGNYLMGQDILAFTDLGPISGSWDAVTGTMTLTGTDTLANYELALRSVAYENTSENPSTLTRTVSFIVNDGSDDSSALTRDITITSINDDPTNAGGIPSDIVAVEETASNVDLSLLALADVDAGSSDLTVTLSTSAGGLLTASSGGGVSVSGSGSTSIILTGNLTDLNTFLDSASNVQYTGPTDLVGNDVDSIQVDLTDNGNTGTGGGGTIDLGSVNVDITPVNDAPVEGSIEATPVTFNENDAAIAVTGTITISDVDDTNIESATVQITGNYFNGEDVLAFTNTPNITGVWDSVTGTMTLSGTDTLANYEAALRTITYQNSSEDPNGATRTVSFTVNDGDSDSNTLTRDINVIPMNDAPIQGTIEGTDLAYTENDSATTITGTITISDVDDTNIESAKIQITGNYANGEDNLAFANTANITGSWDAITGTLTLTGSDTLANYELALRSVTYENTSDDPSTATRTVMFTVNDGDNDSNALTRDITIASVNDDPFNSGSLPTDVNVVEETASNVDLSLIDLSDYDAGSSNLTVTLSTSASGILTASSGSGVTVGGSGTTSITLTGNLTDLNSFLNSASSVQYTGPVNLIGNDADTIQVDVTDNGNTGAGGGGTIGLGTVNVDITDISDAPVAGTIEGTALAYTENDSATNITGTITISDVDDTNIESATIQITGNYINGEDTLAFANTPNITGSWDAITGTMTLTGSDTLANYEAALRSVTYENLSDNPSTATRTVTFIANDGDNDSNALTRDITIASVNDDPFNIGSLPTDINVVEETASNVDLSLIDLSDYDAGSSNLTVTLSTSASGILTASSGSGVTVVGSGTTSITLTGNLTDLNSFLNSASSVQYTGPVNLIGNDADTIQVDVTDNGNTGAGGGGTIGLGTVNVDITDISDAPVAGTIEGTALAYTENDSATNITGTITISDVDDTNIESATIQITGNYINGEDTLAFANTPNITGSWDAITGTMTLTGSDTLANYELALRSVTYENGSENPSTAMRTVMFTVNDGDNDSNSLTRDINIIAVNDSPVEAMIEPNPLAYTENDPATTITTAIMISDVDDSNIESAIVQITGNYVSGEDLLAFANTGAITGAWDSATGTMTLTGNDSLANYESALRSVTYENLSENPSIATRTVTFIVNDGDDNSNIQTRDIIVTSVNDNPTNTGSLPSDVTVLEESPSNIDLSLIDLDDVDAGSGSLTITLTTSSSGILTSASAGGVTVGGSGTTAMTLTGSLNDLNTFINNTTSVQYTGPIDLVGNDVDMIQVEVNDNGNSGLGGGTVGFGNVNVDIVNVNDVPIAVADAATVAEGGTVSVSIPGVLGNDLDADGDALTVTLVSGPANGFLTLNPDGSFVYSHDGSETSFDSFVYQIDDGNGGTDTETVSITVTPVNDSPIANDDSFGLNEGSVYIGNSLDLLGNDSDAEGSPLTVSLVNGPINGSLVLNPDGSFTYSHDGSETVTDSFQYRINDGSLDSNIASVTITITPVNDAPVGIDDSYTMPSGLAFDEWVGVLANDSDAELDSLIGILSTAPANGTVILNPDGSFTYTPNSGFSGNDSFSYLPYDGASFGNVTTVSLNVTAVPPPAATPDSETPTASASEPPSDPPEAETAEDSKEENEELGASLLVTSIHPTYLPQAIAGGLDEFETQEEIRDLIDLLTDRSQAEAVLRLIVANASQDVIDDQDEIRRLELASGIAATFDASYLWDQMDEMSKPGGALSDFKFAVGAVTAVSTVGYIFWSLRGGVLVAAALSQFPAWRMIDPLPVLETYSMNKGVIEEDEMENFFA